MRRRLNLLPKDTTEGSTLATARLRERDVGSRNLALAFDEMSVIYAFMLVTESSRYAWGATMNDAARGAMCTYKFISITT